MSESEDLESLKVTELQNELKKRGLDTKGRKADLITRLRQAMNNGIEAGETSSANPDISDEESVPAIVKDETSSPSSAIEDDDEDDEPEPSIPIPEELENPSNEEIESTLNKKRSLTDDEEGEDNEIEKNPNEDNENDELAKQPRKKKSRWGSEEEESPEKQIITTTKRPSDEEDNVSTTSSNRHQRSSRHNDDRHHNNRHSERY
jgi:hypothetical protein